MSTSAKAHAQLISGNPAASATVFSQPAQVTLTFDDDLISLNQGNVISVQDPKNRRVDVGETQLHGATITVALSKRATVGRYKVTYHVISNDGHPVSGFYYYYLEKRAKKK